MDTDSQPAVTPGNDRDPQLEALQARFPKVKPTILFAYAALQADPEISLDDLKVRAKDKGLRVTAATMSAAKRLLSRSAGGTDADRKSTTTATTAPSRRTSQRRGTKADLDVESVIRTAVGKIESHSEAEVDRLKAAMRKAISVLEGVVQ